MLESLSKAPSPFFLSLEAPKGDGIVASFKKRAWEKFLEIGLPTGKEESFRSLPLRSLFQSEVKGDPCPSFKPMALPSKALFLSLEEAAFRFPFIVKDRLEKFIKGEKNPFSLLSLALQKDGAFLYLPPGVTLEAPIELGIEGDGLYCPFLLVSAGKGSSASLIHRRQVKGFSFGVMDFALEEGASIHVTEVEEVGSEGVSFQAFRGEVKKKAHLEGIHFTKGGKIAFNHKKVFLSGEGAEADLSGLWSLKEAMTTATWIEMVHKEPLGRSRQHFKGALFDSSASTFFGEIYVHEIAQQTDAYQLNQNLLLSEEARAEARPNLQIFADDVKASHGATIGGVHPEELFYLKTRGLSEVHSRELLIKAFLEEILSLCPETQRRKEITSWIAR